MKKYILPMFACLLIAGVASAQTTAPKKETTKTKTSTPTMATKTKTTTPATTTTATTATTQTAKPAPNATIRKKYHHKAKKPATKTKVE